jgi:hypothetical protein
MTSAEWLASYDATKHQFKWFIEKHFPGMFGKLESMRIKREWPSMLNHMNDMWFKLPDNAFNIVANPPGWRQFVNLLENPPIEDGPVDMQIK